MIEYLKKNNKGWIRILKKINQKLKNWKNVNEF